MSAGLPDKCDGACVNKQNDLDHCGGCDTKCDLVVSGAATGSASCTSGSCQVMCSNSTPTACAAPGGKACVNLQTDSQYCGNCGTHCTPGNKCSANACAPVCPPGTTACNGSCINLQTDPKNCGGCSMGLQQHLCSGLVGVDCEGGTCNGQCSMGKTTCPSGNVNACVDLQKDPDHCGACGTKCTVGEICAAGACKGFIYASAQWECNATYPTFCTASGQTLCTAAANCPP
jgi:hypothetical protein